MSKIFNIISKLQSDRKMDTSPYNYVQTEMELGLPPKSNDIQPAKTKKPAPSTPLGSDEIQDTILFSKNIVTPPATDATEELARLSQKLQAQEKYLELIQKELEDAREWQADPNAPKFQEIEQNLRNKLQEKEAAGKESAVEIGKLKNELLELREQNNNLARTNTQLHDKVLRLTQKDPAQPRVSSELKPDKQTKLEQTKSKLALDRSTVSYALNGSIFKRSYFYYLILPLLLISVAFVVHKSKRKTQKTPEPEPTPVVMTDSHISTDPIPDEDTHHIKPNEPLQIAGVEVNESDTHLLVKCPETIFTEDARFTEEGIRILSELIAHLLVYEDLIKQIIIADTNPYLYKNRTEALKDYFVKTNQFNPDLITSLPRPLVRRTENGVTSQTGLDIRIIKKHRTRL
ncbi:MAG: hypothetical protein GX811_06980 [Lentisphaerae bacterium]|nr:hypothetical protein [Lentisphaerota bacterium]